MLSVIKSRITPVGGHVLSGKKIVLTSVNLLIFLTMAITCIAESGRIKNPDT